MGLKQGFKYEISKEIKNAEKKYKTCLKLWMQTTKLSRKWGQILT